MQKYIAPWEYFAFKVSQHHHMGILQRSIKKVESDISKALYRPRARNIEE